MKRVPIYATRADGWPLCPMCHEDELWSRLAWDGRGSKPPLQAWIDAGLRCYVCGWDSTEAPVTTQSSQAFQEEIAAQHARLMEFLNLPAMTTNPAAPVVPASKSPAVQRFKLHYGVPICQTCNLAAQYCACARRTIVATEDMQAAADMERRARECKGK